MSFPERETMYHEMPDGELELMEYVRADLYEQLRQLCREQREALRNLRDAAFDTLHAHKDVLECCSITRKRVSEASAIIEKYTKVMES